MRWMVLLLFFISFASCNLSEKDNKESIIVDVRTTEEWQQDGHADCSVNYPLNQLESKIDELKEYKNVTLVCRSGNRAEQAKQMLKSKGYLHAENKGAWQNITCEN